MATFDLNTEGDGYANVVLTVAVDHGKVTIGDVYNGTKKLTKTTHYTESNGRITLLKEYLATLNEGTYTIKVETSQGDATAKVTVADTIEEG